MKARWEVKVDCGECDVLIGEADGKLLPFSLLHPPASSMEGRRENMATGLCVPLGSISKLHWLLLRQLLKHWKGDLLQKDRYKRSQNQRVGIGNLHFHKHLGDSYTRKRPRNTALCLSLSPHRVLLIGGWRARELGRPEWFPLVSSFPMERIPFTQDHSHQCWVEFLRLTIITGLAVSSFASLRS